MKYNINTKQVRALVPSGVYNGIDYHGTPPDEVSVAAGWVDVTPEIQAQIDADKLVADAEAAQARITTFMSSGLHYKAAKFRSLLQVFFGPGAETNRDITADYVTGYFMQATGLTGDQVRDGIFLKELFAELSAWNGGETWTLFEGPLAEVIP